MQQKFYPMSKPAVGPIEESYVSAAIRSGWISSLGEYVERFESDFANFCGVDYAISVSNGTVALHLALSAMGIGPGDEVIVPDLSFVATANTVVMTGAKPVFCDIEAETLCLAPDAIEKLITNRTKAIMPVHLYGHPADMLAIQKVADKFGLIVIEDAAEAHGAEVNGRRVGALGNCGAFSFYGNKNLTTGEGGMITTNDHALAARCRLLRDHAMSSEKRYWHEELGYNYRITNMQAAMGCAQLERADELLAARREVFNHYNARLSGLSGIRLNRTANWASNSYWMVCAEVEGLDEVNREPLFADLRRRGIDTRPYFYPMSEMPYFTSAQTPVAHAVSKKGINLPTYVGLSELDIDYICKNFVESLRILEI